MAIDRANAVKKAFEDIGPTNPLRRLGETDKHILWSLLTIYAFERELKGGGNRVVKVLEEAAKTATDAAALSKRMQSQVFTGGLAAPLKPFIGGFQDLPFRLAAFAGRLGNVMNSLGKPGHKDRMFRNRVLVEASEFVRSRTGGPNDEHLAELFQAINRATNLMEDFSGDAIRKKREHFIRTYGLAYRHLVNQVQRRYKLPGADSNAASRGPMAISPVPSRRPRKLKFPQGLPTSYFHGRISQPADHYLTDRALQWGYSKARTLSIILLEHKMVHLPPRESAPND
jgi:hypothetical protein